MKKLFMTSKPYSNLLKRLLVINTKDCIELDSPNSSTYHKVVNNMNVSDLITSGFIKLEPKIALPEHANLKSYIIISFDNFMPSMNPEFRDCTIGFDILCHTDYWNLGNFQLRPLKIAGYIDGILNNTKLSGIGTLQFLNCKALLLDEELSGYTLTYQAVHGSDDQIPVKE